MSGFVTDASSGESLFSANIILENTLQGVSTSASGYYSLTGLAPGAYTVVCTYIGFETLRQELTLAEGERRRLDMELTPQATQIEEVVVSASRAAQQEARNIGVAQMTIETIKQLPTVFEPDVFRSLQLLPGVKAASDYSSGLYIRGGGPSQTLILLDRTTVYNPSHVFGFFSTFNPDAIKDVRLYKGGFPASYGGRLGSVLDIYNKNGNRREFEAGLSIGLLASRAIVEGPYVRGSWMLAVRRSTLEPLLAALQSVDGVPESFHYYDVNGKVNLDATPNDLLSLSFYLGADALALEFLDDAQLDLSYGNRTLSAHWTHLFSERLLSSFTVTTSRYFSRPSAVFAGTEIKQDSRIRDSSIRGDFEYHIGGRHELEGGFWGGSFAFPLTTYFDGEETFSRDSRVLYVAAYVQDTFRPTPQWMITGGLRATFFRTGRHFRMAPRLTLERIASDNLRLQASYGRYYQFQTLVTNETFSGFDFWLTSGVNVGPAFSDQFILGAKTTLGEAFTLDAEIYYRTMRSLFEPDPFLRDVAGLAYEDLFTIGRGSARGIEIQIQRSRGRLFGFLAYTLGATDRRFPGINAGSDGEPRLYPPKHDRLHDFNAVVNYRLWKAWRLSGVYTFATGQAYSRVARGNFTPGRSQNRA